jgi:hypothetical protein
MNNETLEEAAEKYADFSNDYVPAAFGGKFNETTKRDFIAGAKWQAEKLFKDDAIKTLEAGISLLLKKQEKMYSEEEVLTLLNAFSNRNGIVEDEQLTKKWFEQFKKK